MDWNNDGRKDLIVGEGNGKVRIYLNVGTDAAPVFNGFTHLLVAGTKFDSVCSAVPWVVDWNNDGRKDVICGEKNGRVYLILNTGTDANPIFSGTTFIYNGGGVLDVGTESSPAVVDWNGDGKKDLIVGCEAGTLYYLENKGTDASPVFNGYELFLAGEATLDVGYNSHPVVNDWDNDGRLDVVSGVGAAYVSYFRNPTGVYLSYYSMAGANYEPGTFVNLNCTLRNGGGPATNVIASLTSPSPWCRVIESEWVVGSMATNASTNNNTSPFRVWIETNTPLGITVPLSLAISSDGGAYLRTNQIVFDVAMPVLELVDFFINDSQGNGNCALDPGEPAQLIVRLQNSGYRAENVTGRIISVTGASATYPNCSFGTIERNQIGANSLLPFSVTGLSNFTGLPSFTVEVSFDRAILANRLYLFVEPEYPCSNGVNFAWVDMTGGTSLTLGNDSSKMVTLPFYFTLYQYDFSYVYVFADGYLAMSSSGSPVNTILPSTAGPYGAIAPFWDDLDPSAGGTVRYKNSGISPNRYFVVEWNNVPRRNDPATRVTFQAILHENGDIKFQYADSTGVNADGRSATIGIEDYYGLKGRRYAYNQVGAVSNGQAIYYPFSAASDDTDGDNLPDVYERFYFGNLSSSGSQDLDGDGLSNLCEFRAGTDPRSAASSLRCQSLQMQSSDQYVLGWCSIPGRNYRVWWSTNLAFGDWTLLTPQPIPGASSGINSYTGTVSSATSPSFWRISTP